MGIPANRETKDARIRAHAAFDALWEPGKFYERKHRRKKAYAWLAKQMGSEEVHMGEMTIEECEMVIAICTNVACVDDVRPWEPIGKRP